MGETEAHGTGGGMVANATFGSDAPLNANRICLAPWLLPSLITIMPAMAQCPDTIKRLIDRFTQQSDHVRSPDYNETLIRIDFINPLMSELGWDMDNRQGFAEQYREVVHEDRVKVAGQTKAPDYSFRIGGARKFFLEAKKPAIDIKNNWEPAYQLRRYAWSAKLGCSVLTNFEAFAIYDARIQPKQLEKASVGRREFIRYTEYPDRWDFLSGTFSKDAVLKGEFDRYCDSKKGRGAQLFDDVFLGEIEEWRKSIASSLARNNKGLDEAALNFAVQRIIDRIIFLRIAEDRGTETVGQLQALLNGDKVYPRLCEFFRRADERYNSGLFHFAKEKDRDESPDTLTPGLDVDDRTLKGIIKALYYPQSPYEFTMVSADILGSVYERFLGKVITLTAGHNARIEEKPEVRKAGGVYYTPTYIVDYIVKNTIGKLLDGKTPKEAAKLKVLDPACGSGSFLIGAYQFLLNWYLDQYIAVDPEKFATGKNPRLRQTTVSPFKFIGEKRGSENAFTGWALTIAERKRILLDHIHGVDLDGQAVEVTKLNLLLKCLEGETSQTLGFEQRFSRERALPDLGKNILCGNSLIGTDIISTESWNKMSEEEQRRINPFDYEHAFPQVFKQGGFDAVIGNPPYVFTRDSGISEADKQYFGVTFQHQSAQLNTFGIFVEQLGRLLRPNGRSGFITPNNWLTIDTFTALRRFLLKRFEQIYVINILDRVFEAADVDTAILFVATTRGERRLDVAEMQNKAITFSKTIAECDVRPPSYIIQVSAHKDERISGLLSGIEGVSQPLSQFATVSTGLKVYQTGKGEPPQNNTIKKVRVFHATKRINSTYERYLNGVDVARYCLGWSGEYLSYGDWIAEPRRSVPFKGERLLVRQIPGKPPHLIYGVWTDTFCYNDINSMSIFAPSGIVSLRSLLAVLNSKLISFWFANKFDKLQRRIFPQFKVKELAAFPIACAVKEKRFQDHLAALADSMLSLNKRLAAEQLPQRREQIQREIDATDRQIDQLVYQLYALTQAEIAIVEAATA